MKTKILSIVTVLLIVFFVSAQSFAAGRYDATVLGGISNITQIEVHGNVELYISNGESDKVKVYNNYYSQNALVQQQNGVLRISSYNTEKLVVWVTANDLRSLSVYDNADVKSFGKFSAIDLKLSLNNTAAAQLDMDVYSAKIAVNDHAKADLAGTATTSVIEVNQSASVNTARYFAGAGVQKRTGVKTPVSTVADELTTD